MQGRGEQRLQAHPPVRYALGPPLKRGWPVSAEGVVSIRAGSGPTPLRYGDKKDRREQVLCSKEHSIPGCPMAELMIKTAGSIPCSAGT